MYGTAQVALIFSLALSCSRSHVIWESPNELRPVHGLYVKPSIDGTTGDLYVAATEENGRKTEWLTDQPVSLLAAATVLQPKTVPLSATSSRTKSSPQEDKINTQKRAIISSPAVKYAYAIPTGSEGNVATYPYAIPANSISGAAVPTCSADVPAQVAQPYPFQYFYPPMTSTIAGAINAFKENESSEEKTPIAAPTPYWPQTYGYPYQYIFIDPNTWSQTLTNASPSETPSSSSSETA